MLEKVQNWYFEAVAKYGDDWCSIERYIHQKMAGIEEDDRERLMEEFLAIRPGQWSAPQ